MITLTEQFISDVIITNPSQSFFSPPEKALMNSLYTPSLIESSDSIKSKDFMETNSRALNGFSTNDYFLPQFRLNNELED